jgi:type 1 glutamine amidotransferase
MARLRKNFAAMFVAIAAALTIVAAETGPASASRAAERAGPNVVLIMTHTTGYRHESIEVAASAIAAMARGAGLKAEITDDPARFDEPLSDVRVIALISTTTRRKDPSTEWLIGRRRDALQQFIHGGGGILAVHGAADSHYAWPWYGSMIGARFARHPAGTPTGIISRARTDHPSLHGLPLHFTHTDEWYSLSDQDPRLHPLLTLSPASIGEKGSIEVPVSWAREFEGGRVFYSSLGHTNASWNDQRVLAHYRGGLMWTAHKD